MYQHNKSSESEVKLRQAGNRYKRVFEATKLAYAEKNKTKEYQKSIKTNIKYNIKSIKNKRCRDFRQIANSVLNKSKSEIPPLFNRLEVVGRSHGDPFKACVRNFLSIFHFFTK